MFRHNDHKRTMPNHFDCETGAFNVSCLKLILFMVYQNQVTSNKIRNFLMYTNHKADFYIIYPFTALYFNLSYEIPISSNLRAFAFT